MADKPRIILYEDQNGPYRQFLRDGLDMTPEELFVSFMKMKARNQAFFGVKKKTTQRLTITKPSWI